jgi:hypothetical protein
MKKSIAITIIILGLSVNAYPFDTKYHYHWKAVYHPHNEFSYQHAYCSMHNGVEEYELPDKTRVDCLTDEYAIEFDFANKWAESIGQALHYSYITGRKPKIVLILDSKYKNQQKIYYERVKRLGQKYNISVEYISDEILNINKNECTYEECKCHKIFNKIFKIFSGYNYIFLF